MHLGTEITAGTTYRTRFLLPLRRYTPETSKVLNIVNEPIIIIVIRIVVTLIIARIIITILAVVKIAASS